ncbi:MAG: hypothetical protein QOJ70_1134 [Acidobacteriota bacterium]|jgi:hypothetical protein|nr:hypothetical protein [Acidobacteriota bacterium]
MEDEPKLLFKLRGVRTPEAVETMRAEVARALASVAAMRPSPAMLEAVVGFTERARVGSMAYEIIVRDFGFIPAVEALRFWGEQVRGAVSLAAGCSRACLFAAECGAGAGAARAIAATAFNAPSRPRARMADFKDVPEVEGEM